MKLKKCPSHGYTLKSSCQICANSTKDAHYKFVKIRSVKPSESSAQLLS